MTKVFNANGQLVSRASYEYHKSEGVPTVRNMVAVTRRRVFAIRINGDGKIESMSFEKARGIMSMIGVQA